MLLVQEIPVTIAIMFTVIFICGIPGFLERHLDDETLLLIALLSILVFFALLTVVLIYLLSSLLLCCFQFYLDSIFSDTGRNNSNR